MGTVGGDLASAALSSIASHPVEVGGAVAAAMALLATARTVREGQRRRRRGRWGLAQDRFTALAERVAADEAPPSGSWPDGSARTNPQRGQLIRSRLGDPDAPDADALAQALEREIAIVVDALDRAAFDPTWTDRTREAGADYRRMINALESLERIRPATRRLTYS